MKKSLFFSFLLMLTFILSVSITYADTQIKVLLNGNYIEFSEKPVSLNGNTMVSARDIFEPFGLTLSWHSETQTVTGTSKDINIRFTIGRKEATVNDTLKQLDAAPVLMNGHAMIPLRFFAESLGGQVEWNNESSTVMITCKFVTNPKYEMNYRGNSGGNVFRRGVIAEQGDWIYFSDGNDTYGLYKIKKDGTSLTALSKEDYPSSINVVGNWIYYACSYTDFEGNHRWGIAKMCVDGTKKQILLSNINVLGFRIEGDYLYLINGDDNESIYVAKTDGTGLKKLTSHPSNRYINYFVVSDGYVYYNNIYNYSGEYYGFYRVKNDGTDFKAYGTYCFFTEVKDDYIYCQFPYDPDFKLYKMSVDGSETKLVIDDILDGYIVTDNYIYYENYNENYALYRINKDGSGKTLIDNSHCTIVGSFGDWVVYHNEKLVRYLVKPGSTEKIEMKFINLALYADKYGIKPYVEDLSKRGNSVANNRGRAIAAKEGEWIYYIKPVNPNSIQYSYAGKIYKAKEDGTGETLVCSDLASNINVKDGWIYYTKYIFGQHDPIYKIRTDGTGKTQLKTDIKGNQDYLQIVGDWIYYKEGYMGRDIMRMKLDGSNRQSLVTNIDDLVQDFLVVGDWIYYSKTDPVKDNYYSIFPYKMKTDGSMKSRIDDEPSAGMIVFGDYIYLGFGRMYESDRTVKIDGTEKAVSTLNVVNMDEEWIYYWDYEYYSHEDYKEKLYRVRMDGTGNTLVFESRYIRQVNFAGDWIFIVANTNEYDDNLYRVKKDGTAVMKLTNN